MSLTAIRNLQIKDQTITRSKLVLDFLAGSDLNLTNGANNATITGLSAGVNPNDAVNFSQLQALQNAVAGGLKYRGGLAAGSDLSGNSTGNAYIDGGSGLETGDFFLITSSGTITDGTNNFSVNAGDMLVANKDVGSDAAINVSTDFDLIDNTEASDILRTGDVVDNLSSTDGAVPLSANQGRVLDLRLMAIEAFGIPVYNEVPTVTSGSAVVGALVNAPIATSQQVYLNGLRMEPGAGCDYQISGSTITFEYPLTATDKVLVDYRR